MMRPRFGQRPDTVNADTRTLVFKRTLDQFRVRIFIFDKQYINYVV